MAPLEHQRLSHPSSRGGIARRLPAFSSFIFGEPCNVLGSRILIVTCEKQYMSIETLRSPVFTDDEQTQIVTDLLASEKSQIRDFLASNEIVRSGTKEEIRNRIEDGLQNGTLSLAQLVQFLDQVIPWGKQHVFLYKGPGAPIADWKNAAWLAKLLKNQRLGKYLNATLPLALPERMKLSSIMHDGRRLRVTAIREAGVVRAKSGLR